VRQVVVGGADGVSVTRAARPNRLDGCMEQESGARSNVLPIQ
jgi:hypothetical protein